MSVDSEGAEHVQAAAQEADDACGLLLEEERLWVWIGHRDFVTVERHIAQVRSTSVENLVLLGLAGGERSAYLVPHAKELRRSPRSRRTREPVCDKRVVAGKIRTRWQFSSLDLLGFWVSRVGGRLRSRSAPLKTFL